MSQVEGHSAPSGRKVPGTRRTPDRVSQYGSVLHLLNKGFLSMAKRSAAAAPANNFGILSSKLRDSAVKTFGASAVQGLEDFLNSVYGVHLHRNLPMQYLLGVDVLPLSRLLSIVGKPGVGKSSLGWYMAALFSRYTGMVNLIETENKPNPDMAMSIVDNYVKRPDDPNWFMWVRAKTLDLMLAQMMDIARVMAETPKIMEMNIPVLNFIDSLSAVTSDKAMKQMIEGDGQVGFSAAKNCALFKENLQAYSPTVMNLPVLTVMINHQKDKFTGGNDGQPPKPGMTRPAYMPPERTEGGGIHKDFNFSWVLQIDKGKSSATVGDGSMTVFRFKVKKEAFREAKSSPIEVPLRSRRVIQELEGKRLITDQVFFDWDTALTWLLLDEANVPKTVLAQCFDLKKDPKKGYCSEKLGLEGLTAREMGKAIHDNEQLVKDLQDYVFKIHRKPHYGIPRPDCDVDTEKFTGSVVQVESDVLGEEAEDEGDGDTPAEAVQVGSPVV